MPTIYNIKWTEGTDIMAVVATGYYRQAVAGLPDETPVLISTHSNRAKKWGKMRLFFRRS